MTMRKYLFLIEDAVLLLGFVGHWVVVIEHGQEKRK